MGPMSRDYAEELLAQLELARRRFPEADRAEIVGEIMRNLDDDALLAYAADRLGYWPAEPPGDLRAMAEDHVLNVVVDLEEEWTE